MFGNSDQDEKNAAAETEAAWENNTVRSLAAAYDTLAKARQDYVDALRALYPRGTYVRWQGGPYIGSGTVTGYTLGGTQLLVSVTRRGGTTKVPIEAILFLARTEKIIR